MNGLEGLLSFNSHQEINSDSDRPQADPRALAAVFQPQHLSVPHSPAENALFLLGIETMQRFTSFCMQEH